jgi:hypothetical protein
VVRSDLRKVKRTIAKVEIERGSVISSRLLEEVMVKAEPIFGRPHGC